ncbi:hypothetical protein ACVWXU_008658 [Streptomyces sp. TE33382]
MRFPHHVCAERARRQAPGRRPGRLVGTGRGRCDHRSAIVPCRPDRRGEPRVRPSSLTRPHPGAGPPDVLQSVRQAQLHRPFRHRPGPTCPASRRSPRSAVRRPARTAGSNPPRRYAETAGDVPRPATAARPTVPPRVQGPASSAGEPLPPSHPRIPRLAENGRAQQSVGRRLGQEDPEEPRFVRDGNLRWKRCATGRLMGRVQCHDDGVGAQNGPGRRCGIPRRLRSYERHRRCRCRSTAPVAVRWSRPRVSPPLPAVPRRLRVTPPRTPGTRLQL